MVVAVRVMGVMGGVAYVGTVWEGFCGLLILWVVVVAGYVGIKGGCWLVRGGYYYGVSGLWWHGLWLLGGYKGEFRSKPPLGWVLSELGMGGGYSVAF